MLNVLFRKNDTLKLELQFNSLVLYVNSSNNLVGLSLVKTSQIWKKSNPMLVTLFSSNVFWKNLV